MRGERTEELIRNFPNAFLLLAQIALRARRTTSSIMGLGPKECLIGDFKYAGLTERQYRTAKQILEKHEIATFKPTNQGTIAKLIDTSIFDINVEASDGLSDGHPTIRRRATDGQPTDNKNAKNEKKERIKELEKPSIKDLTVYINEKSYNVNPEKFLSHYESNGWMVGKNKMKDWRAAVRTWHYGNQGTGRSSSSLNVGAYRPEPEPARELTPEEERAERIASLKDSIHKSEIFLSKSEARKDRNAIRIVENNLRGFRDELLQIENQVQEAAN